MVSRAKRDAKIKKFISRHLKTIEENRPRDAKIIKYEITNYEQKQAVLTLGEGLEIEASFVEFLKHQKREAMRCFEATKKVSHQSILTPIFLTYDPEKDRILLFYDRFEFLLVDWTSTHDPWWQQAICDQLQAIKYMQDKGFTHTGLGDPNNFAIKNNKLKLLNITSSIQHYLQTHPQTNEETIKRREYRTLGALMRQRYQEIREDLNGDEEAFFNMFNRNDIEYEAYVQKLIHHPYAKDSKKRMLLFHDIYLLDEHKRLQVPLEEVITGPVFEEYKGWVTTIRNSNCKTLKKALPGGATGEGIKAKFRNNDVKTLVYFLRNINEHKGQGKGADKYFQVAYKEAKRLFPGLLSKLHAEIQIKPEYYN